MNSKQKRESKPAAGQPSLCPSQPVPLSPSLEDQSGVSSQAPSPLHTPNSAASPAGGAAATSNAAAGAPGPVTEPGTDASPEAAGFSPPPPPGEGDTDGMFLPRPLALVFVTTGIALSLVLLLHFGTTTFALSRRTGRIEQFLKAPSDSNTGAIRFASAAEFEQSLKATTTVEEWESALHLRSVRLTSAILGGVLLIVMGTMLLSAVIVGVRTPRGFWGVAESQRHWFVPGVLLSSAGATLLGVALAVDLKLELLPLDAQQVRSMYLQESAAAEDLQAIRKKLQEEEPAP